MDDNNYTFVSGSKLGYYDVKITTDVNIQYYQISNFERPDNDKYNVRSYLFQSNCNTGGCCFEYIIKHVKDYQLTKKELKLFVKNLKLTKNTNTKKIKYRFLDYVEFSTVPPPDGNELSLCNSELIN